MMVSGSYDAAGIFFVDACRMSDGVPDGGGHCPRMLSHTASAIHERYSSSRRVTPTELGSCSSGASSACQCSVTAAK
jgi:hypothetical protein